jgi:hypothetical protein
MKSANLGISESMIEGAERTLLIGQIVQLAGSDHLLRTMLDEMAVEELDKFWRDLMDEVQEDRVDAYLHTSFLPAPRHRTSGQFPPGSGSPPRLPGVIHGGPTLLELLEVACR